MTKIFSILWGLENRGLGKGLYGNYIFDNNFKLICKSRLRSSAILMLTSLQRNLNVKLSNFQSTGTRFRS